MCYESLYLLTPYSSPKAASLSTTMLPYATSSIEFLVICHSVICFCTRLTSSSPQLLCIRHILPFIAFVHDALWCKHRTLPPVFCCTFELEPGAPTPLDTLEIYCCIYCTSLCAPKASRRDNLRHVLDSRRFVSSLRCSGFCRLSRGPVRKMKRPVRQSAALACPSSSTSSSMSPCCSRFDALFFVSFAPQTEICTSCIPYSDELSGSMESDIASSSPTRAPPRTRT